MPCTVLPALVKQGELELYSWVDYFLHTELSDDYDAYVSSVYMFKVQAGWGQQEIVTNAHSVLPYCNLKHAQLSKHAMLLRLDVHQCCGCAVTVLGWKQAANFQRVSRDSMM